MKLGQEMKRDLEKRPQNMGVDSVTFYKIKKKKNLQQSFKLHHRQPMQNSNLRNKTESTRISLFY